MLDRQTNKGFEGVSGPPIRTSFARQRKEASFSVEEASTSGNYSDSIAFVKMSTPSRSRSSAMGDEGYFDWRETMEKRQLESERQVQALLQETRRLREENDVLQIQVSSSGPPHDQRSRGQGANSRHNQEAVYLGIADVAHDTRDERPNE
ncbi:hypothetical protein AAG906_036944 [Vitis piasezkii]